MENVIRVDDVPQTVHRSPCGRYEYRRRELVQKARDYDLMGRGGAAAAQYELPPGKAAYPYHYHLKDEEAYYVVSGEGVLRTPEGERPVAAGDFLFFPRGEAGAHILTNAAEGETLVYLDFDATHDLDVCYYPETGKVGVWGMGTDVLYRAADVVGYYDGE